MTYYVTVRVGNDHLQLSDMLHFTGTETKAKYSIFYISYYNFHVISSLYEFPQRKSPVLTVLYTAKNNT